MSDLKGKMCCEKVWGGYYHHTCGRTAKVEVDGKYYCGIHDPIKRKEKEDERDAKRRREREIDKVYVEIHALRRVMGILSSSADATFSVSDLSDLITERERKIEELSK